MNFLSIMLYLIDVASSLGTAANLLFWAAAIIGGFALLLGTLAHADEAVEDATPLFKAGRVASIIAGTALVVSVIVPSEQTMQLIAASEIGQTAFENEEVRSLFVEVKDSILTRIEGGEK